VGPGLGMVFIHSGAAQPAAGADRAIAPACGGGRACGWGIGRAVPRLGRAAAQPPVVSPQR